MILFYARLLCIVFVLQLKSLVSGKRKRCPGDFTLPKPSTTPSNSHKHEPGVSNTSASLIETELPTFESSPTLATEAGDDVSASEPLFGAAFASEPAVGAVSVSEPMRESAFASSLFSYEPYAVAVNGWVEAQDSRAASPVVMSFPESSTNTVNASAQLVPKDIGKALMEFAAPQAGKIFGPKEIESFFQTLTQV